MITKEQFLQEVRHEIDMLKQHATAEEKERLDFDNLKPQQYDACIYGQLTGDCSSVRAKDLMDQACKRVFDVEGIIVSGVRLLASTSLEKAIDHYLNGEYKGQTWRDLTAEHFFDRRSFKYLSALEGYICSAQANNKGIIAYLKGETENLEL